MAHNPNDIFDRQTHDALDELAREPDQETLRAPIDDQGRVQLLNFAPMAKEPLMITVEPDAIHVERASGDSFGIVDCTPGRGGPISALSQAVTRLTVERHEGTWILKQDPEWRVDVVESPSSVDLFWRTVAVYMQRVRMKRALENGQANS